MNGVLLPQFNIEMGGDVCLVKVNQVRNGLNGYLKDCRLTKLTCNHYCLCKYQVQVVYLG